MPDELKQCPSECLHGSRTGGVRTFLRRWDVWGVCCNACGASTEYYLTEAEAIAAWNQRPDTSTGQDAAGLAGSREDRTPIGRLRWLKSETPLYDGDDPRAMHYRCTHEALDTAIAALRAPAADDAMVGALESIRLKLSYAGQDACAEAVAQSNRNMVYHEVCNLIAAMKEGKP